MPGEFEPHDETWVIWPERTDVWRLGAKPAQQQFASVIETISVSEPVTVVASRNQWVHARSVLPPEVRIVEMTTDDAWIRDSGPTFVIDDRGGRRAVDWRFTAWGGLDGGLYFPWDQDDLVARKVLDLEGTDRYRASMVLEGGAIHSDGEGTLLTTEECLLNPNRNPGLTRREIEWLLCEYTGAGKIVWLGKGVYGDETSGHVDNLACFARPGVVVLGWTEDTSDPQFEISLDARRRLDAARDARGRAFEIVLLPMPGPLEITKDEAWGVDEIEGTKPRSPGDRLSASYVNYYTGTTRIVFPLLDEGTDDKARTILRSLYPEREVLGVPAREILLGGGNIHCITQQVPSPRHPVAATRSA
jgi:agmatine deiminase